MTFSLHQGGVVMSSQVKHTHSHQDQSTLKNIKNAVCAFCIWIIILWSVGYYVNHLSYYWHFLKAQ